jgi:hypothetical protein
MAETFTCVIGLGNGEELCRATFTADEWQTLQEFAVCAQELHTAADLAGRGGVLRYTLRSSPDAVDVETEGTADARTWSAWLHRLRPFVLQQERTHFGRVKNLVRRRVTQPEVVAWLDGLSALFDRGPTVSFFVEGHEVNSQSAFTDWLNGFEYHRDRDKQGRFRGVTDEDFSGSYVRFEMQGMATDKTIAVLKLAQLFSPDASGAARVGTRE